MNWDTNDLGSILEGLWEELGRGAAQLEHPFRTTVLGTRTARGCALRTVILRRVDRVERVVCCYSDVRAAKVAQLRKEPQVEWLFYDPAERVQVRLAGRAVVHHADAVAEEAWELASREHRLNYLSVSPPGTEIGNPLGDLAQPPPFESESKEGAAAGYQNFAVINGQVSCIDWLWLAPASHRRAVFGWDGRRFGGRWVMP